MPLEPHEVHPLKEALSVPLEKGGQSEGVKTVPATRLAMLYATRAEQEMERRGELTNEVYEYLSSHDPHGFASLQSLMDDAESGMDIAEFAAEAAWFSHFFGGLKKIKEEYIAHHIYTIAGVYERWAVIPAFLDHDHLVLMTESWTDCDEDPEANRYVQNLGRIRAIDEFRFHQSHPEPLPLLESDVQKNLAYFDLASGPSIREYLEYLAQNKQSLSRSIIFNDTSSFFEAKTEEEMRMLGLPKESIRFFCADGVTLPARFMPGCAGVIHLSSAAQWLKRDQDEEWYQAMGDLVAPLGHLVITLKDDWENIPWLKPEDITMKELKELFRTARKKRFNEEDPEEYTVNGAFLLRFYEQLREVSPNQWNCAMGTIRPDGSFAVAEDHPSAHCDWISRRTFVFTRHS